jgi:hypothetical protein
VFQPWQFNVGRRIIQGGVTIEMQRGRELV